MAPQPHQQVQQALPMAVCPLVLSGYYNGVKYCRTLPYLGLLHQDNTIHNTRVYHVLV
jgi:hypothetical protein